MAFWDHDNIIFKYQRPKVASAQDFMGNGKPREMTATCSNMEIIQDMLSLLVSKASTEERVNSMAMKGIIDKSIVLILMMYMLTLIM